MQTTLNAGSTQGAVCLLWVGSGQADLGGKRWFWMPLEADEPTRPVVAINLVSLDGEAIRLIDKSRQDSGPLYCRLGQSL